MIVYRVLTAGTAIFLATASLARAGDMSEFGLSIVDNLEQGADAREVQAKALALSRKSRPALTEEFERRLARGRAAMKLAKSQADYRKAVAEFKAALAEAPWRAEAYFNLGVAFEKAGRYASAQRSFEGYLAASPGAADAKKVKEKIYELEYLRDNAAPEGASAAPEPVRFDPASLQGTWRDKENGLEYRVSVTGSEFLAQCARCEIAFKGILSDRSIDGIAVVGSWENQGCVIPEDSRPLQGTIGADGRTISLLYKQANWTADVRPAGLLVSADCRNPRIVGMSSKILTLVR